jgi:hypothetical protein
MDCGLAIISNVYVLLILKKIIHNNIIYFNLFYLLYLIFFLSLNCCDFKIIRILHFVLTVLFFSSNVIFKWDDKQIITIKNYSWCAIL